MSRHERRNVGRILGIVASAALGLTGCTDRGPSSATHPAAVPPAPVGAPATSSAEDVGTKGWRMSEAPSAPVVPPSLVCGPSGAHEKHVARGIACATCHPCGYGVEILAVTYPGGTTSAGSTVDRSGATTTCMTGCHAPRGATVAPVTWNAGPLTCTACHNTIVPEGVTVVSAHPGLGTAAVQCTDCHDTSQHTSGQVAFIGGIDSTCQGCHSGNGTTLMGETPPLLVGWGTEVSGDWHGPREGQGWGGTLLPPFVRGQPAITCTVCHDAHASANPFLLARRVNGVPVLPGSIERSGIGAQNLCESCHVGDRHARCAGCHAADPMPAGAPCLSCHGHEGSLWAPPPGGSPANYHDQSVNNSCVHCHESWAMPYETTPPVITQIQAVAGGTEATISWATDEPTTSFVEYGTSEPALVRGDADLTGTHSVLLTGLSENAEYVFRVRSSDSMRNVTISGLQTFSTLCASCAPTPLVPANPSFEIPVTATAEQVGAWWYDPWSATYCGTFASGEMTGASLFRIAAVPRESCDDFGCWVDEGYGTTSYMFSRAELDAGSRLTFDVRAKYLGINSSASIILQAFDASGAVISNTTNNLHVYDIIGYSSGVAYLNSQLRIPSPALNTTYTVVVDAKTLMSNALIPGKSWSQVSKAWVMLYAKSGGAMVDVYFDNFR